MFLLQSYPWWNFHSTLKYMFTSKIILQYNFNSTPFFMKFLKFFLRSHWKVVISLRILLTLILYPLLRAFAIICRFVLVFLAIHITTFLSYQTPWPQEMFPANNTIIRFIGFSPLVLSDCDPLQPDSDIRIIKYNTDIQVDAYLNPFAILLCYYTLVITSRVILNNQVCLFRFIYCAILISTNILYSNLTKKNSHHKNQ